MNADTPQRDVPREPQTRYGCRCRACGKYTLAPLSHMCAASFQPIDAAPAAAPAAPAPDADGPNHASLIDLAAVRGIVDEYRAANEEGMLYRKTKARETAMDLLPTMLAAVEQQAREIAAMTAERDHEREIRKHDRVDRERAETALSAARAAVAAADAMRAAFLGPKLNDEGRSYKAVKAYDAARAAMGDGNG